MTRENGILELKYNREMSANPENIGNSNHLSGKNNLYFIGKVNNTKGYITYNECLFYLKLILFKGHPD